MNNRSELASITSLICVSISMATVIQILQIIMLVISILMTLYGLFIKIKEKRSISLQEIQDAKKQIDDAVDKIDKIKGDKDE